MIKGNVEDRATFHLVCVMSGDFMDDGFIFEVPRIPK